MRRFTLALVAGAMLATTSASAVTVLYRNDINVGTDQMAAALASIGATVTTTSGTIASFTLSDFDIVVYANQLGVQPIGDRALVNAYLGSGGKVIYQNWLAMDEPSNLGGTYTFNANQTSATINPALGGGTLNFFNPGWSIFTTGLSATTGTVLATFGNGEAAIIGTPNSYFNGWLTDTISSPDIYIAELNALLADPVPAPASVALLGLGILAVGLRRRAA